MNIELLKRIDEPVEMIFIYLRPFFKSAGYQVVEKW